jgi:hypothetical protein
LKYVPCQVLFIHRYSGNMPLATAATISSSYLLSTVNMIYALHLCPPGPAIGLPYPGVLVFAVGIAGNLYHHYLLSRLRSGSSGGDKGHRIPRGGLFELVPALPLRDHRVVRLRHDLADDTVASGTAAYLTGRSCATRRWYQSKFEV